MLLRICISRLGIALFISCAIFSLLFCLYHPIYETNDDAVMSMISGGYGIAFHKSSHIMFSNIIYGFVVSHLPSICSIEPYSYMTFVALFMVCFILVFCFEP